MGKKYFYWRYWGIFISKDPRVSAIMPIQNPIIGIGYSGHGAVLNEPTYDDEIAIGCLPAGLYTITSTDNEKGPLTHHLTPDPQNNMKSRSGFLNHGDNTAANHTASDGCIVSPYWTRSIFKVGDQFQVI